MNRIPCLGLWALVILLGSSASQGDFKAWTALQGKLEGANTSSECPIEKIHDLAEQLKNARTLSELAPYFQSAWELRVQLSQKSREWLEAVRPEEELRRCADSLKRLYRELRNLEDLAVADWASLNRIQAGKEFQDPAPLTLSSTLSAESIQFQSGDILLSRGTDFTSAMIGEYSKSPLPFSHLSLIWVDPKDQKAYAIDALGDKGVKVVPLWTERFHLANVREVLYRPRDANLGKRAADFMEGVISEYNRTHPDSYPFDFELNDKDTRELFCAEVASLAYHEASHGQVRVPRFFSEVNRSHPRLNWILSIEEPFLMSPGDFEVDPRFELIAEWRNPAFLHLNRLQEVAAGSFFEWMFNKGYDFYMPTLAFLAKHVAWQLRQPPFNFFKGIAPPNFPKRNIQLFLSFQAYGKVLMGALEGPGAEKMTRLSLKEKLEAFRHRDGCAWEKWKHQGGRRNRGVSPGKWPELHLLVRNPKNSCI